MNTDHFLGGNARHVEQFYPFMGTVMPLDKPRNFESTGLPEFRHLVDPDSMGFIMESNQAMKLKGDLRKKKMTDISSEVLQLLQYAKIEKILREEFVTETIRALVQLDNHALVLKTPKGLMDEDHRYLRQRLDEIDKYAIDCPAKILEMLKRGPGKKKMAKELPEGCSFNVDDKKKRVIFLGGKLSKTEEGNEKAKACLSASEI